MEGLWWFFSISFSSTESEVMSTCRSSGYTLPSQIFQHPAMAKDGELSEQFAKTTSDQLPNSALAPTHFPHFNMGNGGVESHLDLQRKLIEHQIEVLMFNRSKVSGNCFH